ncbi:MAG: hypothetical protein C5B47_05340, partial [Verrucomicrobia bacterium]
FKRIKKDNTNEELEELNLKWTGTPLYDAWQKLLRQMDASQDLSNAVAQFNKMAHAGRQLAFRDRLSLQIGQRRR